jgi:hypothetical protein
MLLRERKVLAGSLHEVSALGRKPSQSNPFHFRPREIELNSTCTHNSRTITAHDCIRAVGFWGRVGHVLARQPDQRTQFDRPYERNDHPQWFEELVAYLAEGCTALLEFVCGT